MALIVKLNGNNYVSDKTKGAFAQALEEVGSRKKEARMKKQEVASQRESESTNSESRITNYDAQTLNEEYSTSIQHPASSIQHPASSFQLLDHLDHALDQSYEHQTLTMRVHEQYLNNQSDYASIFSQLMQQQGAIFANGATNSQQAESVAQVLETLSRSMTRFHDLQEQTLDVHKQFLAQQSEYARATIQLLKEQHTTVVKGNGNGNGHHPVAEPYVSVSASQRPSVVVSQRVSESASERVSELANSELRMRNSIPTNYESITEQPMTSNQLPITHNPQPVTSNQQPATSNQQPEPTSVTSSTTSLDVQALTQSLLSIVSDKTGYPADMLELDMDMEADLGIDSIKRVEILGALQDAHPELPDVETDVLAELRTLAQIVEYMGEAGSKGQESRIQNQESRIKNQDLEHPATSNQPPTFSDPQLTTHNPQPTTTLDTEALTTSLLSIVSDKTGYPAEMLELDMDMEADLGIDSIKRVEILGALQDAQPDLPEVETDVLAELRTLGQIVDYMQEASSIQHPKKV